MATSQAASIVARHGALKINAANNAVVDSTGNPLQLTGMSMYWDIWSQGSDFYNKGTVDWLVSDWQASILRVPMGITDSFYSGGPIYGAYPNDSAAAIRRITPVIDAVISDGIYVIIDWHEYSAPTIPHAKAFFAMMAKKYGDLPNVIFEIWNEPVDVAWSDIVVYADSIIPVIRQYSNNLVIVGTPQWSGTLSAPAGAKLDPTKYGSVAYTDHFYTCSNTIALQGVLAASKKIPAFVTEWGASQSNGGNTATGANDNRTCLTPGQGNAIPAQTWFTSWLDPQKISNCNWSVSNADQSSAALKATASYTGNWSDTDLSPSGTWVRNNIRAHCAADPTVCPYEGAFAAPPVLAVPGTIPAASFAVTDGIATEPTQEASGGQDLSSIDSGDFVSYSVNAASADTLWLQARVADVSGGLILVQLDGLTADSIRVYPTGGVQTWSWADGTRLIPIAAGAHTLTLRFYGSGRDLLRLQRLEVVSKRVVATPVPSQISLDDFNGPLVGLGLGPIFEAGGPSLRHATTRSKALYKVSAAVADSLPLSIAAANGSPDPASVVVWKKGPLTYAPFDTLVVAPSGWTSWQTLTLSRNIPLDTGTNYLQFTFLGDTGTALLDLGALSIGTVVTAVQPQAARNGAVSLRREGQTLKVGLPDGGTASVELLSADGRIWAQRTLVGSGSLPVPRTRQSLWLRVRGQSSAVLAVPPGL
jgi:endoglucanase